jgi:hypothetical protein
MSGIVPSKRAGIDRMSGVAAPPITPSVGGLIFWSGFSDTKCEADDDWPHTAARDAAARERNSTKRDRVRPFRWSTQVRF